MASVAGVRKTVAEETKTWVDEKTSQEMKGKGFVAGRRPVTEGQAVKRAQHTDEFTVPPERRKALGIQDHEEVCWKRNPKTWEQHEMRDDVEQWLWQGEGHRVVTKDGKPDGPWIKNGDVVMCVMPKSEIAARDAEMNENVQRDYGPGETTELKLKKGGGGVPQFQKEDVEQEDIYESSQRARMEGLVGTQGANSTAGQFWGDVMRQMGREAVEQEQAYYRGNARHSDERNRQVMNQADPHQPRAGKIHGMGAGFDKEGRLVRS